MNKINPKFNPAVSGIKENKKITEPTMKAITDKSCKVLADMAEREVPENGDFRNVFVEYKIPDSQNEAIISIVVDKNNSKTQRYISAGVHRQHSDRLLSNYVLNGTKKEVLEFLSKEENRNSLIENINKLSERVDEYYNSL